MTAFPDVKVILTVRDPRKWYESMKNTVYQLNILMTEDWMVNIWMKVVQLTRVQVMLGSSDLMIPKGTKYNIIEALRLGEQATTEFYNAWKDEVIANVPEDRLLVFSVKEGWDPLVKFLGVPKPDNPFPNLNDTAQFQWTLTKLYYMSRFFCLGLPTITAMVLYWYVFL